MGFLIQLYVWGVIAELLFHSYALIMYSFGFRERSTYQSNLNKVDLSWDPVYLNIYPLSAFKHTALRFWGLQFADFLGTFLSWYQVLSRVHKIMKVREINSMLTSEQKQAAFLLRNNPMLSKEEVIEKVKILDPSLPVTVPLENRQVGYAKFSTDCFWCDRNIEQGEMVLYYGEPPAQVPWRHKTVIFHYSCALTLDLDTNSHSSLTLWANLKERFEAGQKLNHLLLKDSPKPDMREETTDVASGHISVEKESANEGRAANIEPREVVVLMRLLERAGEEEEEGTRTARFTKFISELENAAVPLAEFMAPLLEKKSQNPVALADFLVELSEEENHDSAIEITRKALDRALIKRGWVTSMPLSHFIETVKSLDDSFVVKKLKVGLEKALGRNDSPVLLALNARLTKSELTE